MPSIIKVDQIQSDTGTVNVSSNMSVINVRQTATVSGSYDGTYDPSLQVRNNAYGGSARLRMGDGGIIGISNSNLNSGADIVRITTSNVLDLQYGQLKFPTTQNASSDPNTLDDYEEGTWTPTLTGSTSGTISGGAVLGNYTKVGRLVHAYFTFINPTTGLSLVGDWRISLPFAIDLNQSGGNNEYLGGTVTYNRNINVSGNWLSLLVATDQVAWINLYANYMNGTESVKVTGTVPASMLFAGQVTYFTN